MRNLFLSFLIFVSVQAESKAVNNTALFRRCYALITQTFPGLNHPLLPGVAAGQINPIDACLQILDKGRLGADGTVANTADVESRKVLNNFHALHYSWFEARDLATTGNPLIHDNSTRDIYDIASGSYYYTRALFNPAMKFSDIFTTNEVYGAIRTIMNPATGLFTGQPLSNWAFKPREFTPYGDLLGIRVMTPYNVALGPRNSPTFGGTVTVFRNWGGGVLGSAPYINYSSRYDGPTFANASGEMPRKWSKAVFHDFICRQLPVVRVTDILKYVVPTAPITFRKSESCVRCHATMDQMGGVIRNASLTTYEAGYEANIASPIQTVAIATTAGAEGAWPTAPDYSYYARPPTGRLVFRSYDGTAVDVPLASASALGQQFSQLNDVYVCAAKRYYQYFMGVDIPMKDFADPDPNIGYQLTSTEQKHWNQIVKLGLELKEHQSARRLIESILRLNSFRESDFDGNGDLL